MKKSLKNLQTLLIRSPFCLPGDSAEGWRGIQSRLAAAIPNLQSSDAAADFFKMVMVAGRHAKADTGFIDRIAYRVSLTDEYDPVALLTDLASLDHALDSVSAACKPCRFHRHGFAHPGLKGAGDVMRFAHTPEGNPFHAFAHGAWQPFADPGSVDLALLYVDRPGQMGPAATLATAWSKRWPGIPLKLAGSAIAFNKGKGSSEQWPFEVISGKAQLQRMLARDFDPADKPKMPADPIWGRIPKEGGEPLIPEKMPAIVQAALDRKQLLVEWRAVHNSAEGVFKQLHAAARQGIWNHLILDENSPSSMEAFAVANPNIVHSFCHIEQGPAAFCDPELRFPATLPPYGRTRFLPGTPLWMALRGTAGINKMLNRYDPRTLRRLRLQNDGRTLLEVGRNLSYHYKRPSDLPRGYLDEIVRMVAAGGSVNTRFVRHNLERAYLIAYVEEGGLIVANSCLKHPRQEYIDAVSRQAGVDLRHYLERGYASVRPEYRGLGVGGRLMAQLTDRGGQHRIFSVIAESNIATQKMAVRNGNRRVATFYSERAQKEMSVWIPERMLPKGLAPAEQPLPA